MALIYYSLAGEGRGHATRARTLVDLLRIEHRVVIFASGAAYELLSRAYSSAPVIVRPVPGLFFRYGRKGVPCMSHRPESFGFRLPTGQLRSLALRRHQAYLGSSSSERP